MKNGVRFSTILFLLYLYGAWPAYAAAAVSGSEKDTGGFGVVIVLILVAAAVAAVFVLKNRSGAAGQTRANTQRGSASENTPPCSPEEAEEVLALVESLAEIYGNNRK